MINPFGDFPSEKLRLCKKNGKVNEDVEMLFDPDNLQIRDTALEIEEGDVFERTLPNGKVEKYEVTQCDYFSGTPDFPPAYDCKIKKLTGLHPPTKSTATTYDITSTQGNTAKDNAMIHAKQYKSFNSNEDNPIIQTNKKNVFLFITANEHEREAFEKKYISQKEQYILGKTYYIGIFARYPAAYIHMDEQGITSPATAPLVSELVRELNPVAVVMVGIAFGADKDKQKIGDVLVSDKILPYDSQRLLENETEYKETPKEVGFQLLNAFREHRKWIYHLPNSELSRVYIGAMLTGSRLINNYAYRTQLLNDFAANRPIGGEMEAQGIYSMCRLHGVAEWIIVKGICDWGYEKNVPNKDELQIIAANAAVDYCFYVFSRGVFDDLISDNSSKKPIDNDVHVNPMAKIESILSSILEMLQQLSLKDENSYASGAQIIMTQNGDNSVQFGHVTGGTINISNGSISKESNESKTIELSALLETAEALMDSKDYEKLFDVLCDTQRRIQSSLPNNKKEIKPIVVKLAGIYSKMGDHDRAMQIMASLVS